MEKKLQKIPVVIRRSDEGKNLNSCDTINANAMTNTKYKTCWFCEKIHDTKECEQFSTQIERAKILKNKHRCCYCLDKFHYPNKCRKVIECRKCNKEGHTILFCDQVLKKLESNADKERIEFCCLV